MTDVTHKLVSIENRLDDWHAKDRRRRVRLAAMMLTTEACVAYIAGLLIHHIYLVH
jgi:hypothetical protein